MLTEKGVLLENNLQAAPNRLPFVAPTVGLLKQVVGIATGESPDDLAVYDTLGSWIYELPDFATPPEYPYIGLKPAINKERR